MPLKCSRYTGTNLDKNYSETYSSGTCTTKNSWWCQIYDVHFVKTLNVVFLHSPWPHFLLQISIFPCTGTCSGPNATFQCCLSFNVTLQNTDIDDSSQVSRQTSAVPHRSHECYRKNIKQSFHPLWFCTTTDMLSTVWGVGLKNNTIPWWKLWQRPTPSHKVQSFSTYSNTLFYTHWKRSIVSYKTKFQLFPSKFMLGNT